MAGQYVYLTRNPIVTYEKWNEAESTWPDLQHEIAGDKKYAVCWFCNVRGRRPRPAGRPHRNRRGTGRGPGEQSGTMGRTAVDDDRCRASGGPGWRRPGLRSALHPDPSHVPCRPGFAVDAGVSGGQTGLRHTPQLQSLPHRRRLQPPGLGAGAAGRFRVLTWNTAFAPAAAGLRRHTPGGRRWSRRVEEPALCLSQAW